MEGISSIEEEIKAAESDFLSENQKERGFEDLNTLQNLFREKVQKHFPKVDCAWSSEGEKFYVEGVKKSIARIERRSINDLSSLWLRDWNSDLFKKAIIKKSSAK